MVHFNRTQVSFYTLVEDSFIHAGIQLVEQLDDMLSDLLQEIDNDTRSRLFIDAWCNAINQLIYEDEPEEYTQKLDMVTYFFRYYYDSVVRHINELSYILDKIDTLLYTHFMLDDGVLREKHSVGDDLISAWNQILDRLLHINDEVIGVTYDPNMCCIYIYHF